MTNGAEDDVLEGFTAISSTSASVGVVNVHLNIIVDHLHDHVDIEEAFLLFTIE